LKYVSYMLCITAVLLKMYFADIFIQYTAMQSKMHSRLVVSAPSASVSCGNNIKIHTHRLGQSGELLLLQQTVHIMTTVHWGVNKTKL